MRYPMLVAIATVCALGALRAQDTSVPPAPTAFFGLWQGEGQLFGRPARFVMRWSSAIDDRFARLEFASCFVDGTESTPVISAEALYLTQGATARGVWADSRGELLDLRAEVADDGLRTTWRSEAEIGRTVYQVTGAGEMVVHDSVETGDGWREFGIARYRRVSGTNETDTLACQPRR